MSPVRFAARLLHGAALATLVAGGAHAQGTIDLAPGFPTPSDPIHVTVGAVDPLGPCFAWRLADRIASSIRLAGTPIPASACTPSAPPLDLGRLAAGHYVVTAFVDGAGSAHYAEARFDVSNDEPPAGSEFAIALSPPSPRAGQPFALVFTSTQDIFNGVFFDGAPPSVLGDRIVLTGERHDCNITCPRALEAIGFRHLLAGLPAGNKTVEIRDQTGLLARFGFHVDADTTRLPVVEGRFEVTLRWTDRAGAVHDAIATRLTEESGQFWFFGPSNPEVTVKLVDGTDLNHHWWVFVSSLTNLGFTLTVRNTACDVASCVPERRYTQDARHNRNFIDTSAFPECTGTCPP